MEAHEIFLAEWKENAAACIEGNDPLLEHGGIGAYMRLFPGEKKPEFGAPHGWIDPYTGEHHD